VNKLKRTAQNLSYLKRSSVSKGQGFTLVELLVVIAIIAILAAVVLLIINPLELTRRGRDSARLADMANLQNLINISVQEATNSGNAILCNGGSTPCIGRSTDSGASVRKPDGSGWVKANLAAQKSVSVPTLPVDPVNNATYHYTYCSDGSSWEIDTVLESQQFESKMSNDGGDENTVDANNPTSAKYEVGSSLTLVNPSGACTY
jgi:prepilin-type N-terminal cleavage/methylation domain-containing protein